MQVILRKIKREGTIQLRKHLIEPLHVTTAVMVGLGTAH